MSDRPLTSVGRTERRHDAVLKTTGAARYTADITLPGMLHAKVLRSPHAHARIVSLDASRARAVPGVRAVLTRDELGETPGYGFFVKDQPVVARDRVRYAGDVVAADDEAAALAALAVEELPPLPDIPAALAGAPPNSSPATSPRASSRRTGPGPVATCGRARTSATSSGTPPAPRRSGRGATTSSRTPSPSPG
ncbi:hypothetical protein [Streptomyces albidoflavus]|uniref:hypothetical protein n=1 Tax=Streptomyces albidoflavus TaxID=1886 RepID=UPI0021483906|nr:hypothetical protein [Streptomyces albidoflavus]MCR0990067.1 hypothetical protein [Streptomyces albidoflavus]